MVATGYAMGGVLVSDAESELWQATRPDGTSVLLRFGGTTKRAGDLSRFHHEFELLQGLDCDSVPSAIGLEQGERGPFLVLVDPGADCTLSDLLRRERVLTLDSFLNVACRLADAVAKLHQAGVVHRGLRPANILIASDGSQVQLVGLGRATRIPEELHSFGVSRYLESAALPFLAPEQTGRMNRTMDHRADLYSLGVIFYQLLTGELPLEADDLIGWIHAHIALEPKPLPTNVPRSVAQLIMRLLAKDAGDRYQNGASLRTDLREARRLAARGEIERFELSPPQPSGRFLLAQNLYGREEQARTLQGLYDEIVVAEGRHLVLAKGHPGIGKTALVHEVHRSLARHGGHFASGKFDADQRTPLSAIRQALASLAPQLAESDTDWNALMSSALGGNLPLLTNAVPELEFLVGAQPAVEFPAADAHDLFRLVFRTFLGVVCRPERPLVLFLDDLQWADVASLELIEDLLCSERVANLLLIGAYRDNEVAAAHPLSGMLARLGAKGAPLTEIELEPLRLDHIRELVADSFGLEFDGGDLARALLDATDGNPFFVRQCLRSFFDDGSLRFDVTSGRWLFDRPSVRLVPDTVVELLVQRLRELPSAASEALRISACVGTDFDLETASRISSKTPAELLRDLWPALESRLIVPQHGREWVELGAESADLLAEHAHEITFRFRHDRIRQAAYSLVEDEQRPSLHLRIARLMRASPELDRRGFDTAQHYNQCLALITEPSERAFVAQSNLSAAERAASATGHGASVKHAEAALTMLEESDALTARAHRLRGGGLSKLSRFDEAEQAYQRALDCTPDELERVEIQTLRMELFVAQGKVAEALTTLTTTLALLDVDLTPANVASVAENAARSIAHARAGRAEDEIVEGAWMRDAKSIALMDLLGRSIDTAYMSGRDWVIAVTATAVRSALEHGITVSSSMTFATYGLTDAEPTHEEGMARRAEYGRIGARIARRFGARDWISRSGVSNPHMLGQEFADAAESFRAAAEAGWESGALTWAAYGHVRRLFMMLSAGIPLDRVAAEWSATTERLAELNRPVSSVCCEVVGRVLHALRGSSSNASLLGASAGDEGEFEQHVMMFGPWAAAKYFSMKQMLATLHGQVDDAQKAGDAARGVGHALLGMTHEHLHHLFTVMNLCDLRSTDHERIDRSIRELDARAAHNSEFEPSFELARGVICEREEHHRDALAAYARAVVSAHLHAQTHLAALASERAGGVARALGLDGLAQRHLRDAISDYELWGARAKVTELRAQLHAPSDRPRRRRPDTPPEGIGLPDSQSLIKACHAISSELRLDALLRTQIRIVVENVGAQHAVLVLEQQGVLVVAAQAQIVASGITVTTPSSALGRRIRPVVEHVFQTGESVRLDDLTERPQFGLDGSDGAQCLLCLPIESKGARLGVLCLEHRAVSRAFPQRLDGVLSVLVGQIATSLENAFLFRRLETERDYSKRIIDKTPLILCGLNANGETVFVNGTAEKVTGYSRSEIVGTDWWRLTHRGKDLEHIEEMRARMSVDDEVRGCDSWLTTRDGQRRLVEWTWGWWGEGDEQLLLCFGNDVTEAELNRQKREALEQRLQQAQKLESMSTLAAGIAHDINNILVPIVSFASLLEEEVEHDPALLGSIREIASAADRATAVVRQLLVLNREKVSELELVSVVDVVEEVSRLVRASLGASIVVNCSTVECPAVLADASELHQVILNLATNAGQAMQDGGTLTLEVEPVVLEQSTPGVSASRWIRVTVEDTGTGIDSDTMNRIFDPFFTTKETGTGLGLWVVHGIVERMGGTVEIQSEVGVGTTVRLLIPAHEGPVVERPSRQPVGVRGDERIMLVDDEPTVLRAMRRMLTRLGYRVTGFEHPSKALDAFRADPSGFDAVITDFSTGGMDGGQLADELSRIRPGIPIVLTSGVGTSLDGDELERRGIGAVIQKPARVEDYAMALRRLWNAAL